MCLPEKLCELGVFFINDLVSSSHKLYTYVDFLNEYNSCVNFVEYYGVISAIPVKWRILLKGVAKLDKIENELVDKVKKGFKTVQIFIRFIRKSKTAF